MKKLYLLAFILVQISCSQKPKTPKGNYEIVYEGIQRYDNAKTFIVYVPGIRREQTKARIPLLIKEMAETIGSNDFSVEFFDQKESALNLKSNYEKPSDRTKSELDSLNLHQIASYDGGLQFEGKPAFTYLYELNYLEEDGSPSETIEFKPLN